MINKLLLLLLLLLLGLVYPSFIWTTHRLILGCHSDNLSAKMQNIYKSSMSLNHQHLTLSKYLPRQFHATYGTNM
jgi:hypothetical protein